MIESPPSGARSRSLSRGGRHDGQCGGRRWQVSVCAWAVAVSLLAAGSATAQEFGPDVSLAIGRTIAAGVVLATQDFASGGRYTADNDEGTEFRVRHLGGRHRFSRSGRWEPFIGAEIGQLKVDQELDLGVPERAHSDFDVWGIGMEGGSRVDLGGDWFSELRLAAAYTFAESKLRYPNPELEEVLGPIIDGKLFNWEAEAMAYEGSVILGWDHRSPGLRTILQGEATALRTDPVSVDDPVQDETVDTHYERLRAAFEIPLGVSIFDRPLRIDPSVQHTFLAQDLSVPLDSNSFTDLRVAFIAEWPEDSRLPISGLGVAVRYTQGDSFEGWSVGISLGH